MESTTVTVNILGRNYRLKVIPQEEEFLQKAADLINEEAKLYGKNFNYNDHQDLLTMVALSKITELVKIQQNIQYTDNKLIEKLTDIDTVLENYLHPTQNSL